MNRTSPMDKLPDYMFTRKFLFLTVLFIVAFSILFLKLYSPFSSTFWFSLKETKKCVGTILMYSITVFLLTGGKLLLIELNRKHTLGMWGLVLFSVLEVLALTLFYTAITILVQQEDMYLTTLFPKAFVCIFLMLLIPYVMVYLYGYARALQLQSRKPVSMVDGTQIVSIHDSKGKVKLSLRIMDMLYAVAEDNYVKVFYEQDGAVRNSMIRTTAKRIEKDLEGMITRCHRSYLVNMTKVKLFNNDRENLYVILDREGINPIPVSRSYRETVSNLLSRHL